MKGLHSVQNMTEKFLSMPEYACYDCICLNMPEYVGIWANMPKSA